VVAHFSIPQGDGESDLWLSRHTAFLIAAGLEPDQVAKARETIETHLPILAPEQDEAILQDAGFSNVQLFYMGFAFRGWVAYA
jgi:tRNA (cmo5U34)-methyltransferase